MDPLTSNLPSPPLLPPPTHPFYVVILPFFFVELFLPLFFTTLTLANFSKIIFDFFFRFFFVHDVDYDCDCCSGFVIHNDALDPHDPQTLKFLT